MPEKPSYQDLEKKIIELERKQSKEALQMSKDFLSNIINTIGDPVFVKDDESRFILANDSLCEILGIERENIIGKTLGESLPDNQMKHFLKIDNLVLESGQDNLCEEILTGGDGNILTIVTKKTRYVDEQGSRFIVGTIRDITERKKIEESLIKNESLFRGMYDNMTSGSAIYEVINDGSKGSDFIIKSFNKKSLETEGKTLDQVVGQSLLDLRPNIDDYGLIPVMKKVWETGEPAYFPIKIYQGEMFSNYYENFIFKIQTGEVVIIYDDVTVQKNAEKALQDSEIKYKALFNNAQVALFRTRISDGKLLEINERYANMAGYPTVGDCMAEFNAADAWADTTGRDKLVKMLQENGSVLDYETKIIRRDKVAIWISFSATIFHEKGYIEGSIVDITELKQAEEELSRIFELSPDLIGVGNLTEGYYKRVNPAYEIFGRPLDEFLSRPYIEFIHPDDHNVTADIVKTMQSGQSIFGFENRYRCKDGSYRTIDWHGTETQADGTVYVVGRDVTDRKKAELFLEKSEASLRDAQRIANIGNWSLDLKTGAVKMSEEMLNLIGLKDKNEALNVSNHEKYYTPESWQRFKQAIEVAINKGTNYEIEMEFSDKYAKFRNAVARGEAVYGDGNKIIGLKGTLQDITERKKLEKILKKNERRYKSAQRMGKVGNWEYDIVTEAFWGSDLAKQIYGFDPEDDGFTTDEVENCIPERERVHQALIDLIEKDIPYNLEFDIHPITGPEIKTIRSIAEVIKDETGLPLKAIGVVQDITEQKKMEQKLRNAQRMESIGTFAGGIAHDFNNILFPIMGFTEMSMEELPDEHPVRENLEDILQGAKRARDLVKQILAFSSQRSIDKKSLPLQPIIEESLKFIKSIIPSSIGIEQDFSEKEINVFANSTEIHEIIMNLCTNAYHAMETKGGILKVSLFEKNPGQEVELPPGDYCCLTVSDTGPGIPPDVMDHIFDPYFTTKEQGKGTGLGLSVLHGIVKTYNGTVDVQTELGKGTSINVFLPITKEKQASKDGIDNSAIQTGSETILFVDDEAPIVKLGVRLLERLGYKVLGKTSSVEALKLFKSNPEKFDIVITDMTMPILVGTELAKHILKVRPGIPILLCTGFSEQVDENTVRAMGVAGYINKPILAQELSSKVRELLDQDKGN